MKKMFLALSMLLVTSAFATETPPVVTPFNGDACTGERCVIAREASIDLLALRGGVDADLRICRIELNHTCENCQEDYIKLFAGNTLLTTVQNGGFWADGGGAQPTRAVLFLNSLRKGQTFALTFCASARRVIVGDPTLNAAVTFAGSFDVNAGAVTGFNTPFAGGAHIDGLRYKVERRCGADQLWTQIGSNINLVLGQGAVVNANFTLPSLVQLGETGTVGGEAWRCLTGACQFKVTFGEFDRCFRLLDDVCTDGVCRPSALLLRVRGQVRANFACIDTDPDCSLDD